MGYVIVPSVTGTEDGVDMVEQRRAVAGDGLLARDTEALEEVKVARVKLLWRGIQFREEADVVVAFRLRFETVLRCMLTFF